MGVLYIGEWVCVLVMGTICERVCVHYVNECMLMYNVSIH